MRRYAVLIRPAANRVYAAEAARLLRAEMAVLAGLDDVVEQRIGGVDYLAFDAADLDERTVATLSNASALYALFEVCDDLLRPVTVRPLDLFGSDLLTIQKYSGKTNEQFTKLLLNVTAAALPEFLDRPLRVFDPMCGRGTTLNQALMYGFDAFGMDIDGKDFESYAHFLRTWLKNSRLKHHAEVSDIRRNRAKVGRRMAVSIGATKEKYKAGETIDVTMVNADTLTCGEHFRPDSADAIVTDLPYGVQHGASKTGDRLARNPLALVTAALPAWQAILRPGGAIGMSWNTNVASREQLAAVLTEQGFSVLDSPAHQRFAHRVDASIRRDLIVATKLS